MSAVVEISDGEDDSCKGVSGAASSLQPALVNGGPFKGCRIAIARVGSLRGAARCSIIAARIREGGGMVADAAPCAAQPPTHVLVGSDVAERCRRGDAPALALLAKSVPAASRCQLVSEAWYEACVQAWRRQGEEAFEVRAGAARARGGGGGAFAEDGAVPRRRSRSRSRSGRQVLDKAGSLVEVAQDAGRGSGGARGPRAASASRGAAAAPASVCVADSGAAGRTTGEGHVGPTWRWRRRAAAGLGAVAPVAAESTPRRERALRSRAHFACQQALLPATPPVSESNVRLAQLFEEMAETVLVAAKSGRSDEFRARQYRRASQVVRRLGRPIQRGDDLRDLRRQVGPRIFAKIEEWLAVGTITKARVLAEDPMVRAATELCKIWGVGRTTAALWYRAGLRSVDDVRARAASEPSFLTRVQHIGVRHFEEFQVKIPREEVTAIFQRVTATAREVFDDPALEVECCGSFRRGRQLCGDVDVLICSHGNGHENRGRLDALIGRLAAEGFVTSWSPRDRAAEAEAHGAERGSATFLGVCRLSADLPHRRLDIKVWPDADYAFALLHFTGSAYFNRSMRLFARRMGYTLSDHGLCECRRGPGGVRSWAGPTVACRTEREIFSALGLEYVPPERRDIAPAGRGSPGEGGAPGDSTAVAVSDG